MHSLTVFTKNTNTAESADVIQACLTQEINPKHNYCTAYDAKHITPGSDFRKFSLDVQKRDSKLVYSDFGKYHRTKADTCTRHTLYPNSIRWPKCRKRKIVNFNLKIKYLKNCAVEKYQVCCHLLPFWLQFLNRNNELICAGISITPWRKEIVLVGFECRLLHRQRS